MFSMAWRLGRRTIGVLLDEAPVALLRDVRNAVGRSADVLDLEQLRMRRSGSRYFVDLRLGVARTLTLERSRQVKADVTERIQHLLPNADVMIETEPREPRSTSITEQVRAIAQRDNLNLHDLSIYAIGDGLGVEFHLEVDEQLPLKDAHDLVSRIESQMRQQIPSIREILTHIEPETSEIPPASFLDRERISRRITALATGVPEMLDCHDVQVKSVGGHLCLTCHCSFPDALAVGVVHEQVTRFEAAIKREFPELFRVTIHTEPSSDNRR
jgi:divalent metal cation (Fe/Co/Zn/Cd) transporter